MTLNGRVTVITGVSRGLGKAIALALGGAATSRPVGILVKNGTTVLTANLTSTLLTCRSVAL